MAEIRNYGLFRHFRSSPAMFVLRYRRGKRVASGPGLTFWFLPLSASMAEVPLDDRELPFAFHGRSSDFQDVTTQGVITYRVAEPLELAAHVDFTVDSSSGSYEAQPLEIPSGQSSGLKIHGELCVAHDDAKHKTGKYAPFCCMNSFIDVPPAL